MKIRCRFCRSTHDYRYRCPEEIRAKAVERIIRQPYFQGTRSDRRVHPSIHR